MELEEMICGKPQTWNGLTVYPVRMKDYPLFLLAKESVAAAQQTLPMPYAVMDRLNATYHMEGLFPRLCTLLALSFGLPREGNLPLYPQLEGDRLAAILVVQGEYRAAITPANFQSLRELIAFQNGFELPDETQNAELVEAQRDLEAKNALPLKADLESLIYSVAVNARTDPETVMGWTIRRFQQTERALDRSVGHLIASLSLAAGGKFKSGNPYPSWKFDREEATHAIEPLSALTGRLSGAVEQK